MEIQRKLIIATILISIIIISGTVFQSFIILEIENGNNYHNEMSVPALIILKEIDSDFLRLTLTISELLLFDTSQNYDVVKISLLKKIQQYDNLTYKKSPNGNFYADSIMQNKMQSFVEDYHLSILKYDELFSELPNSDKDSREIINQLNLLYDETKQVIDADIQMEQYGETTQQELIKEIFKNSSILSYVSDFIIILLIIIIVMIVANSIKIQQIKIQKQDKLLESKNLELETELLEKQKELIKAERFSAIGELSSRIAHDIRNPLGVIRTSLENMTIKHDDPEFIKKSMSKCDSAVNRITHQINEVMDFLKDSPLDLEPLQFSDILKSALSGVDIPEGIKLVRPTNDAGLLGDKIKLESLFYNLIINSIQKLKDKGIITIRVFHEENNMVKIIIEDNGTSIPDDSLKKIFEPLYTTKQSGTGLGLASCLKIVQQHNGFISVSNDPVTFSIILPMAN